MSNKNILTLGQLKASGYKPKSIKEELRRNLIKNIRNNENPFNEIIGFDDTVIPDLQRAILSRHNIILLGLRGQAKTRIARLMTGLLDEYIPVIKNSELNEDPLMPITKYGIDTINEKGDAAEISWLHRSERYTEKLATPDVSIADLIGDVDPIKAATLKLPYSDERVIHFGLLPRSHRSIFVINELPDLQARIQVALFNMLQEEDIQIRGFKLRLNLDIQFIFTANPEDYTNRGSIVTPLKDRIDSQILTHYPKTVEVAKQITGQESEITNEQKENIFVDELLKDLIEQIAFEARNSEYIDSKSGVSARLTISAYENLYSAAERRMILNNEEKTYARISDLFGIIPSITGKVELVYEGEIEGPQKIALILIGKAVRSLFTNFFPDPEKLKKSNTPNPYQKIINWFGKGNYVDLLLNATSDDYQSKLENVNGLRETVTTLQPGLNEQKQFLLMEFLLFGLAEYSLLSKHKLETGTQFRDMLSSMFTLSDDEEDDYSDAGNYR